MKKRIFLCFIIICSILIININMFPTYAAFQDNGVDSSYGRGGVVESGDKISIKYEISKPDLLGEGKGDIYAYNAFSKYYNENSKIWTFSKSDLSQMQEYSKNMYISGSGDIIEQRKMVKRVLDFGVGVLNGEYSEEKMLKYGKDAISNYTTNFRTLGVNSNIAERWYDNLGKEENKIGFLKDTSKLLSDETKKSFKPLEIQSYVNSYGIDGESSSVIEAWKKTIIETNDSKYQELLEKLDPDSDIKLGNGELYKQPKRNENEDNSEESLEDMISDADSFVKEGELKYDDTALQNFSKTFYNIMLTVGVFAAVIVGAILGIRIMLASASERADAKKMLVPYAVGCFIIFGGFGIWKIVLTILEGI